MSIYLCALAIYKHKQIHFETRIYIFIEKDEGKCTGRVVCLNDRINVTQEVCIFQRDVIYSIKSTNNRFPHHHIVATEKIMKMFPLLNQLKFRYSSYDTLGLLSQHS
jgi:hypothetical protein